MELSPEEKMLAILGTTKEAITMSTAARTHRKQYMGSCSMESHLDESHYECVC